MALEMVDVVDKIRTYRTGAKRPHSIDKTLNVTWIRSLRSRSVGLSTHSVGCEIAANQEVAV